MLEEFDSFSIKAYKQPLEIYKKRQKDIICKPSWSLNINDETLQLPTFEINLKYLSAYGVSLFLTPPLTRNAYSSYSKALTHLWTSTIYFDLFLKDREALNRHETLKQYAERKAAAKKKNDPKTPEIIEKENKKKERYLAELLAQFLLLFWNLQPISELKAELGYVLFYGISLAITDKWYKKFKDKNGAIFLKSIIEPDLDQLTDMIELHFKNEESPRSPEVLDVINFFWRKQPSIGEILAFLNFVPE